MGLLLPQRRNILVIGLGAKLFGARTPAIAQAHSRTHACLQMRTHVQRTLARPLERAVIVSIYFLQGAQF